MWRHSRSSSRIKPFFPLSHYSTMTSPKFSGKSMNRFPCLEWQKLAVSQQLFQQIPVALCSQVTCCTHCYHPAQWHLCNEKMSGWVLYCLCSTIQQQRVNHIYKTVGIHSHDILSPLLSVKWIHWMLQQDPTEWFDQSWALHISLTTALFHF